MTKTTLHLLIFILIPLLNFAQTPEKISFQAIIRNAEQQMVSNSKVDLRIVIKQGSKSGPTVYKEFHHLETNTNGLVSLEIGTGQAGQGRFNEILWEQGPYFIETSVDPKGNSNYTVTGINEISSVPYALHAKSVDNFTGYIKEYQIEDLLHFSGEDIRGNEIAFENWDKDASDDFSGIYTDLKDIPKLYTSPQIDSMLLKISSGEGKLQELKLNGNELSITGGNKVILHNFSGNYSDLTNIPQLYSTSQIDSMLLDLNVGEGKPQELKLNDSELQITGGNIVDLKNLSLNFQNLKNTPNLYTSSQIDSMLVNMSGGEGKVQDLELINNQLKISGGKSVTFENWDTDASDDFSGIYTDLKDIPELYTSIEIDSMLVGLNAGEGKLQELKLDGDDLQITGGNTVTLNNFSGNYADLKNTPQIYNITQIDSMFLDLKDNGSLGQNLELKDNELKISDGKGVTFENWDTDANDDFDGDYNSLTNVPKLYTQKQVDSIKNDLLETISKDYLKKAKIISFSTSRVIQPGDVGNTIACTQSSTLSISKNFKAMANGETINIEIHGTELNIKGNSGVIINGVSGGSASLGNKKAYTGGILRKINSNSYIVL